MLLHRPGRKAGVARVRMCTLQSPHWVRRSDSIASQIDKVTLRWLLHVLLKLGAATPLRVTRDCLQLHHPLVRDALQGSKGPKTTILDPTTMLVKKVLSNAGIQANLPDRARGCIDMHHTIRSHRGARDPTTLLLLGGILSRSGSYALHQVSLPLKIAGRHALHKSPALSLWNLNVHTGTLQSYSMDCVSTIRLLRPVHRLHKSFIIPCGYYQGKS